MLELVDLGMTGCYMLGVTIHWKSVDWKLTDGVCSCFIIVCLLCEIAYLTTLSVSRLYAVDAITLQFCPHSMFVSPM